MDMQKFVNIMREADRRTRSNYHLTLGAAIKTLEQAPPDAVVEFSGGASPGEAHSYRGYYSDLSFGGGDKITAAQFLEVCRSALGATFEGYKGGDFTMGEKTPLWCAPYGMCGPAIIAATVTDGKVVLVTKEIDD
jgi:hypothetical protein